MCVYTYKCTCVWVVGVGRFVYVCVSVWVGGFVYVCVCVRVRVYGLGFRFRVVLSTRKVEGTPRGLRKFPLPPPPTHTLLRFFSPLCTIA
jgi:hypothetical protein